MRERALLAATLAATAIVGPASEVKGAGLEDIATIVVIYAENRSFDNLYGSFPGANGLSQVTPAGYTQLDRDGSVLKELPPVWDGLTAKGVVPPVTQAQTEHLPNARMVEFDGDDHPFWYQSRDEWLGEVQEFLTGARAAPVSDRMLATVLFTDIVDSTRTAVDLGDRHWREMLERHQRAVREDLDRFNGREVKSTGDGFLATFDGPARAIRCAQAILQSSEPLGISVRAGDFGMLLDAYARGIHRDKADVPRHGKALLSQEIERATGHERVETDPSGGQAPAWRLLEDRGGRFASVGAVATGEVNAVRVRQFEPAQVERGCERGAAREVLAQPLVAAEPGEFFVAEPGQVRDEQLGRLVFVGHDGMAKAGIAG